MEDGKPFCFKCKKWLKENNDTNNNNTNNNDNKDSNGLFVNYVTNEEDKDDKNILSEQNYLLWLGDTGAQCDVRIANKDDIGAINISVPMVNNMKASAIRKEDIIIQDELGSTIILRNTRVVKGLATNIISFLQLVEEG